MSAGMAGVIAVHIPTASVGTFSGPNMGGGGNTRYCSCGARVNVHYAELEEYQFDTTPLLVKKLAAHVAEELAKAGYGNVPAALLAAADEMPIETLAGADKASVWLRHRAHSQDPEGHALVKAIHDRKAEGPPDHALWCRGGHEGTCQRGRASGTEA